MDALSQPEAGAAAEGLSGPEVAYNGPAEAELAPVNSQSQSSGDQPLDGAGHPHSAGTEADSHPTASGQVGAGTTDESVAGQSSSDATAALANDPSHLAEEPGASAGDRAPAEPGAATAQTTEAPASGSHGSLSSADLELQATLDDAPAFDASPAPSQGDLQGDAVTETRPGTVGAESVRVDASEVGTAAVARGERGVGATGSDSQAPWSSEVGEASGTATGKPGAEALARAERILQQVRLHIRPHMNQASLQLNPASLGRVDIQMEVEDGELTAIIRAERPEALSVLERHLPELRSMFQQSGVEVADLNLGLGFQGEGASADSESQGRGQSRPAQAPAETERPIESAVAARISDLGVDTYA